jgi:hypothetical protein
VDDVNGDGEDDLVCHFANQPTNWEGWEDGANTATLTGNQTDGTSFKGSDAIVLVSRRNRLRVR